MNLSKLSIAVLLTLSWSVNGSGAGTGGKKRKSADKTPDEPEPEEQPHSSTAEIDAALASGKEVIVSRIAYSCQDHMESDLLGECVYMKVDSGSGGMYSVTNTKGDTWNIGKEILATQSHVALAENAQTVKRTTTQLSEILGKVRDSVVTIEYAHNSAGVRTSHMKEVLTKFAPDKLMPAELPFSRSMAEKALKNIVKELQQTATITATKVITGRIEQAENGRGCCMIVGLDRSSPLAFAAGTKPDIRLVDHHTIKNVVLRGIKYELVPTIVGQGVRPTQPNPAPRATAERFESWFDSLLHGAPKMPPISPPSLTRKAPPPHSPAPK